jgi:hypothetical protein
MLHMLVFCPYSPLVWWGLKDWIGTDLQAPPTYNYQKFKTWWNKMLTRGTRDTPDSKDRVTKVIYTTGIYGKIGVIGFSTTRRCQKPSFNKARDNFPCPIMEFPIKYLGIPLALCKPSRVALQLLVDKVADALPAWKGHLMHRSSHLTLIKTTLLVMPIYTFISIHLPPWLQKVLVRISKTFLWSSGEVVQGGKCLMVWSKVARPLDLGNLGVLDLNIMGRALWLSLLWAMIAPLSFGMTLGWKAVVSLTTCQSWSRWWHLVPRSGQWLQCSLTAP